MSPSTVSIISCSFCIYEAPNAPRSPSADLNGNYIWSINETCWSWFHKESGEAVGLLKGRTPRHERLAGALGRGVHRSGWLRAIPRRLLGFHCLFGKVDPIRSERLVCPFAYFLQ
jgi:hypothetical protein